MPSCRLYYVTTGTWTKDHNLEARREGVINDLRNLQIFGQIDFLPVDAAAIQRLYRESRNSVAREFEFSLKTVVPEIPGVTESYVGLLPAKEFLTLITDTEGDMLRGIFYDNVRDWQDFNAVNSEIRETLASKNRRLRFALMNNGVTIIAKTLRSTANRFYIEDYQIVNGCQTSHVLFDQREALNDADAVMVPLRLISTKDEDVISSIIKATNRQTEVREEQLLALSDFQKKLEAFFGSFDEGQRLYYERRSRQYNGASIEKTRLVTPGGLIRAFAAIFLAEPHRATKSYRRILDRVGKDIFSNDHKVDPYYVAALAAYRLEYLFRNQVLPSELRAARYEILMAWRMAAMPEPLPKMSSNDIERKCKQLIAQLWDAQDAENQFKAAAKVVQRVAGSDLATAPFRTESFTESLKAAAKRTAIRKTLAPPSPTRAPVKRAAPSSPRIAIKKAAASPARPLIKKPATKKPK